MSCASLKVVVSNSRLALGKTLENFNFDRLPKLNRSHLHDLTTSLRADTSTRRSAF